MKTQAAPVSEGWIFDEDRALRDLLDDIKVSDSGRNNRRVGVWFGIPDQELRQQSYPYITIDLLDISMEADRAERGWGEVPVGWRPSLSSSLTQDNPEYTENLTIPLVMSQPIPVRLTYQITTWARNPRHDRQILSALFRSGITPLQGGGLRVSDGTLRRLDLVSYQKRDTIESNKRLLSNAILVAVSSEVPWGSLERATALTQVGLHLTASDGRVLAQEELTTIQPEEEE